MFPEFSPNSKVWIYTANRALSEADQAVIADAMKLFLPQWAAHGNSLYGGYTVENNRFLILVVDEVQALASGCSIDTSVRFIKDLGAKIGVDFFNRLNLIIEAEGELKTVHVSEVRNFPDAFVFNPMITNLQELRANWKVQVADSPFA